VAGCLSLPVAGPTAGASSGPSGTPAVAAVLVVGCLVVLTVLLGSGGELLLG
jgi:hypothetical protein